MNVIYLCFFANISCYPHHFMFHHLIFSGCLLSLSISSLHSLLFKHSLALIIYLWWSLHVSVVSPRLVFLLWSIYHYSLGFRTPPTQTSKHLFKFPFGNLIDLVNLNTFVTFVLSALYFSIWISNSPMSEFFSLF